MQEKLYNNLIEKWVESKEYLKVFLRHGIRLEGVMVEHNNDSIVMNNEMIVFKNAISTIAPMSINK